MPLDIVGRSISNVKYSESATGAYFFLDLDFTA